MIAILVPSRNRVEQCKRMVQSVIDTSESEIIIYLGVDDVDEYREVAHMSDGRVTVTRVQLPDGMPTAHKWNLLAEMAMRHPVKKLFMLGSDDIVFSTPLWDRALIEGYNLHRGKPHVWALQDSRDEFGYPHPIVNREYIDTMGWFMPPYFLHWQIDKWTVKMATTCGCFSHYRDYLLIHDKPSDQGNPDETFLKIRSQGWRERDEWVEKKSHHVLSEDLRRLGRATTAQTEGNWVA